MAFLHYDNYISFNPEETMLLGEKIGGILKPGDIVALEGKLGVGKTIFARGIAKSLGVKEEIMSPTYTIVNEYEANAFPFYHMDMYRISNDDDFRLTGGEELLYGNGVCVVEWPERINLPSSAFFVQIEIMEDGRRLIRFRAP